MGRISHPILQRLRFRHFVVIETAELGDDLMNSTLRHIRARQRFLDELHLLNSGARRDIMRCLSREHALILYEILSGGNALPILVRIDDICVTPELTDHFIDWPS